MNIGTKEAGRINGKIETADIRTFEELNLECGYDFKFGKDKNYL